MAIDYWCNIFTPEGIDRCFRQPNEIAQVVKWWGMESRLVGRTPSECWSSAIRTGSIRRHSG